MAGTIKEMSLIKQILQLKQQGESNRSIARKLPINKDTVNRYLKTITENKWSIEELLALDDPVLEYKFHAGSPAYSDERMQVFLDHLPYYREQLSNPKLHVNRQLLYEEYKAKYPNGYGREGIGLRQMMDYFYVLKTAWKEDSFDRDVLVENLKNVNLYRFAQAVMWVLHEVFGLEQKFFIVPADVRRGRLLLDEILKGGNFGKYSGITNHSIGVKYFLKVKRNMRFVRTYPVEALFEPLFRTWHFFWRLSRR